MDIETKGLGAGSYPEPKEKKEKTMRAKVYISFDIEESIPENWEIEDMEEYIKEHYNEFEKLNFKIEEIEL